MIWINMAEMRETQRIFNCPACKTDVMGTFSLEAKPLGAVIEGKVEFEIKVVGLYVKHDCVPTKKRTSGEPTI